MFIVVNASANYFWIDGAFCNHAPRNNDKEDIVVLKLLKKFDDADMSGNAMTTIEATLRACYRAANN